MYENRTPIDIFSSNIYSDALGQSGDILGYIKDAGGGYYEEINKTLNEIQELYKKHIAVILVVFLERSFLVSEKDCSGS